MKQYLGIKLVNAKPMTRGEYNMFRQWVTPPDEVAADEGYLVEYLDGGKPNTDAYAGYVSWCPKEQFENANTETVGMTFGSAIAATKVGACVQRAGWNGKGMFIFRVPGTKQAVMAPGTPYAKALATAGADLESPVDILPHYDMWTINADGRRAFLPGWLASQSDIDANDWQVVL